MTITEYFASLGAPLKNMNWSWGAVADGSNPVVPAGTVILRTWTHCAYPFRGKTYYHIFSPWSTASHGQPERERHVELIKQGAKCMLIVIEGDGTEIKRYHTKLHRTGELLVGGVDVYIEAV